jgi:hypothetical protein
MPAKWLPQVWDWNVYGFTIGWIAINVFFSLAFKQAGIIDGLRSALVQITDDKRSIVDRSFLFCGMLREQQA